MKSIIPIYLAVEDVLSEAVIRKTLITSTVKYSIGCCYGKKGKDYLKKLLPGLNNSSKGTPHIVIVDLDKTVCAPLLVKQWMPKAKQNNNLIFRIAVQEIESWILAHRTAVSIFLGISVNMIPQKTDTINNPKEFLIGLAKRSRYRNIRDSIVPKPKSTAKIGPDYNGILTDFVNKNWLSNEAIVHSDSLSKAVSAFNQFKPIY